MDGMSIRRRILTLVLMALMAVAVAVQPSSAGGGNNVVVVSNTTDGQTLASSSTQVIPVPMDSVTSSNVAVAANAGCVGCHSSAVAVQILMVVGSPHYFAPGNAAAAANGGCDSCGAYAYARQHWIQTSSMPPLGGAGHQRNAELRQGVGTPAAPIPPSDAGP